MKSRIYFYLLYLIFLSSKLFLILRLFICVFRMKIFRSSLKFIRVPLLVCRKIKGRFTDFPTGITYLVTFTPLRTQKYITDFQLSEWANIFSVIIYKNRNRIKNCLDS
jgi:hypothetical protein